MSFGRFKVSTKNQKSSISNHQSSITNSYSPLHYSRFDIQRFDIQISRMVQLMSDAKKSTPSSGDDRVQPKKMK